MSKTNFIQLSIARHFPSKTGCYVLRYDDIVLYVGQAVNLHQRWKQHQHKQFIETLFPDVLIQIIPCEIDELDNIEKELIATLRPIWNGVDKMKISSILGVPSNWWKPNYNLKKWFDKEEERKEKMRQIQRQAREFVLDRIVLH